MRLYQYLAPKACAKASASAHGVGMRLGRFWLILILSLNQEHPYRT